jgi:hypothetical protein
MQGRPTRVLLVTPPASASLVSLAPSVGRARSMILTITTSRQSPQFQPLLLELKSAYDVAGIIYMALSAGTLDPPFSPDVVGWCRLTQ